MPKLIKNITCDVSQNINGTVISKPLQTIMGNGDYIKVFDFIAYKQDFTRVHECVNIEPLIFYGFKQDVGIMTELNISY